MPMRGAQPKRIIPLGLSDAPDGSAAFPGAMAQLGNLIPLPNATGIFVPRPAMTQAAFIPDSAGQGTALVNAGNLFYGMKPSTAFPGQDTPFIYTGSDFTAISGLSAAALPTTQPTTGDWTPPTIGQVAGRVIFTHPGFPGGTTAPPVANQFFGNITSGSTSLIVGSRSQGQSLAGANLYGPNIPAGTAVVGNPVNYVVDVTGTWTQGSTTITVTSTVGLYVGLFATGPGLAAAVTVVGVGQVTINYATSAAASNASIHFIGLSITMSKAATGTAGELIGLASPAAVKFGWLDVSGFSISIVGDTPSVAAPFVSGGFNPTGIQPGMTITGPGIAAGTTVLQARNVNFIVYCGLTINSNVAVALDTFTDFVISPGMTVSGPGIPTNTTVTVYTATNPNSITLSQAVTTGGQAYLTFSGAIIVLSNAPTGLNRNNVTFTVAGGSPSVPLWGAGDLNINPIASTTPPVFVSVFNNRAWFGVNTAMSAGVQASDAGAAGTQTFASQTLLFDNAIPVTAADALPLLNQLGGIVQSLMVFQSDTNIQQITGDFSTSNIAVNTLNVATGTLSPNTLASTSRGLLFAATDGLRLIDFNGQVTDPLGEGGQGLVAPFINAVTPSRASASFNENVYRLTITWQPPPSCQPVWGAAIRTDEFWFHLAELGKPIEQSRWSGPHVSRQVLSAPWPVNSSFLVMPRGLQGQLFRSDPKPLASSVYIENTAQLSCLYQSLLTPDDPDGFAQVAVETTAWLALTSGSEEILATATDDFGQQLDQAYISIGPFSTAAQRAIPWHTNLIFRQMSLKLAMAATGQLQIGSIVLRTKRLGYQLPYPVSEEFILSQDILGGPSVLGP